MPDLEALEQQLRACALALPETHEDFPWGERAIKVRKKVFLFLRADAAELSLTVKLPASHEFAALMEGCEPTGYGLGRSGWITARVRPDSGLDRDLLPGWIAESYRAVAPKTLVKLLPDG